MKQLTNDEIKSEQETTELQKQGTSVFYLFVYKIT